MDENPIDIFPYPAADFTQPIELIEACHQRIRRSCSLLGRLAVHLANYGADNEARHAARSILRYFDEAAPNHHLDEEADLFPALLKAATEAERKNIETIIARLVSEHASLDGLWKRTRIKLEEIEAGEAAPLSEANAHNLGEAYDHHIRFEESELLPLARRLLGPQELARLGASMAARRGAGQPAK
jgi:hemerythrin-like domain-containing protein